MKKLKAGDTVNYKLERCGEFTLSERGVELLEMIVNDYPDDLTTTTLLSAEVWQQDATNGAADEKILEIWLNGVLL